VALLVALIAAPARAADFDAPPLLTPDPALGSLPAPPRFDPAHRYTLPELVELAETANPQTRIAWDHARSAAGAAAAAGNAYLPRLDAVFLGGAQDAQVLTPLLGRTWGDRVSGTGLGAALTLQWLLFDFGARSAAADADRQGAAAAMVGATAAQQKLVHAVCLAYYAHAAALARLDNATESLEHAQALETAARARYAQGVGTVVDAAQAGAAAAQASLGEVQARNAVRNAYVDLLTALGVSPLASIALAPLTPRALPADAGVPLERLVADALARRTDLREADALRRAAADRVRAAEAEFKPKVFAAAQVNEAGGAAGLALQPPLGPTPPALGLLGHGWGGSVMLGVAVPLFDGGMRAAAVDQARTDADSAAAGFEQVRDLAVRQIVVDDDDLQTSLAASAAATLAADAARVAWDAASAAYQHGVGAVGGADAARIQLLAASNAASDAYFAARAAAVTLALSAGTLGGAPQD
jgi:outer membrane protein TolC